MTEKTWQEIRKAERELQEALDKMSHERRHAFGAETDILQAIDNLKSAAYRISKCDYRGAIHLTDLAEQSLGASRKSLGLAHSQAYRNKEMKLDAKK